MKELQDLVLPKISVDWKIGRPNCARFYLTSDDKKLFIESLVVHLVRNRDCIVPVSAGFKRAQILCDQKSVSEVYSDALNQWISDTDHKGNHVSVRSTWFPYTVGIIYYCVTQLES